MPHCAACSLFQLESENETCLHINRPGGLELTRSALADCRLPAGSSVLDAACGTGTTLQFLREQGFQAAGLDLSMEILNKRDKRHFSGSVIQADCNHTPLPSASQDAILMECALSLSNGTDAAFAEFRRLLRPEGWLVITDIYIRELNNPHALVCLSDSSCLSGAQTEDYIRQKVDKAGFIIHCWQDQTLAFKQWMAQMIFKLGSLNAFYRQLATCEDNAKTLTNTLGNEIKLGYYWMTAQKSG